MTTRIPRMRREIEAIPVAVAPGFPVLAIAAADAAEPAVADALAARGAEVLATSSRVARARRREAVRTGHWLTDPLALIVSFCSKADAAAGPGVGPDAPRHPNKVTETI